VTLLLLLPPLQVLLLMPAVETEAAPGEGVEEEEEGAGAVSSGSGSDSRVTVTVHKAAASVQCSWFRSAAGSVTKTSAVGGTPVPEAETEAVSLEVAVEGAVAVV
jgi:hypothetical protein